MPSLRKLVLLPAVLTAVVAGSLATAAPASADITGTTSSGEVVLYNHCQQHPIDYQLVETPLLGLLPLGWRLELQVFSGQGRTAEGSVLNSAKNPPLTGTVYKLFCGSEPAGTYSVKGVVRGPLGDALSPDLPVSTFTVRAPYTKTSLKRKKVGPGTTRLTTKVQEETEAGWARANGVTLKLQKMVGGAWKPVKKVVLTTTRGQATTTVKGRGVYRTVVPARNNLGGSESRAVWVR